MRGHVGGHMASLIDLVVVMVLREHLQLAKD